MSITVLDYTNGNGAIGLLSGELAAEVSADTEIQWHALDPNSLNGFRTRTEVESMEYLRQLLEQLGNPALAELWVLLADDITIATLRFFLNALHGVTNDEEIGGIRFVRDGQLSAVQGQFGGVAPANSRSFESLPNWAKAEIRAGTQRSLVMTNNDPGTMVFGSLVINFGHVTFDSQVVAPEGASVPTQRLEYIRFHDLPQWAQAKLLSLKEGSTLGMLHDFHSLVVRPGYVFYDGVMVVR